MSAVMALLVVQRSLYAKQTRWCVADVTGLSRCQPRARSAGVQAVQLAPRLTLTPADLAGHAPSAMKWSPHFPHSQVLVGTLNGFVAVVELCGALDGAVAPSATPISVVKVGLSSMEARHAMQCRLSRTLRFISTASACAALFWAVVRRPACESCRTSAAASFQPPICWLNRL